MKEKYKKGLLFGTAVTLINFFIKNFIGSVILAGAVNSIFSWGRIAYPLSVFNSRFFLFGTFLLLFVVYFLVSVAVVYRFGKYNGQTFDVQNIMYGWYGVALLDILDIVLRWSFFQGTVFNIFLLVYNLADVVVFFIVSRLYIYYLNHKINENSNITI